MQNKPELNCHICVLELEENNCLRREMHQRLQEKIEGEKNCIRACKKKSENVWFGTYTNMNSCVLKEPEPETRVIVSKNKRN